MKTQTSVAADGALPEPPKRLRLEDLRAQLESDRELLRLVENTLELKQRAADMERKRHNVELAAELAERVLQVRQHDLSFCRFALTVFWCCS
jgi:hypothetical protein